MGTRIHKVMGYGLTDVATNGYWIEAPDTVHTLRPLIYTYWS